VNPIGWFKSRIHVFSWSVVAMVHFFFLDLEKIKERSNVFGSVHMKNVTLISEKNIRKLYYIHIHALFHQ
jgi:hypothetical protein